MRHKKNNPLVLQLRPGSSRLKVEARIYPTQREMLAAIRKDHISGIANNTMAFCATERKRMKKGFAAIVYFSKTHITHGTVSHEFDHAAFAVMARRRVGSIPCTTEDAPKHEEDHATLVEEMVEAFHKQYGL